MNIALKKIGLSLLLAASLASAFAGSGSRNEEREAAHAARQQQRAQEREAPQGERNRGDARQYDAGAPPRNGKLSPDERRALRRQINEAGQDIYSNTPRR